MYQICNDCGIPCESDEQTKSTAWQGAMKGGQVSGNHKTQSPGTKQLNQLIHRTASLQTPIPWSFSPSNSNIAEVESNAESIRALPRCSNVAYSNGKEKDYESGFHYYGARYYWGELMTGWLSVDPMMDKYPNVSPYAYCVWNPVKLVDPDGMDLRKITVPATGKNQTQEIVVDSRIAGAAYDFCWAMYNNYGVTVTSSFRSQTKQTALREMWDKGCRRNLVCRPAAVSAHSGGFALDFNIGILGLTKKNYMTDENQQLMQELTDFASQYGFSYGGNFDDVDPVHFYMNENAYGYENRMDAIRTNDMYSNIYGDDIPRYQPGLPNEPKQATPPPIDSSLPGRTEEFQ